jgi:hypothetical protein
MTDLGRRNQRTAQARTGGVEMHSIPRAQRADRFDRHGREVGLRNPAGKVYEPCPMPYCGKRAAVRTRVAGGFVWKCEACGYEDHSELGALN